MPTEPRGEAAARGDAAAGTRRAVLAAALITVLGIFGSRVLGLARVMVQSQLFSPDDVGALRAAFDLPDLLFYIVAGGALRSGFVPVFVDLLRRGHEDREQWKRAWWLFSVLVTLVGLASVVFVVLGVAFAVPLTAPMTGRWSATGFSPEATAKTIHLVKLLLPAQIFLLVGGVLSGTLDSLRRFAVTALVPCFYNLCIIGSMVALGRRHGVDSAAYGVIIGGFLGNLCWQGWALSRHARAYDFRYRPAVAWRDPLVQRVVRLAAPIILGLCVAEVNLKIAAWAGAQFGAASRAWFDNASRIARLPDGIFGAGLGIALFPFLSLYWSEGKEHAFKVQAEQILRLAIVCTAPLAALLFVVPYPPTALLFRHGVYSVFDTEQTAVLLRAFAVGIVPLTLTLVLTRVFYSRHDSMTPLRTGLWTVAFAVTASIALGAWVGVSGPPLAFSLACWFNAALLLQAHRRDCGFDDAAALVRVTVVGHAAALGTALVGWVGARLMGHHGPLVQSLVAYGLALGLYAGVLRALRLEDVLEVMHRMRRRALPTPLAGADTEP